jgi:carboxymethylenebutenolidase
MQSLWSKSRILVLLFIILIPLFIMGCPKALRIKSTSYDGDIVTYMYTPSGKGPFPAVIVLHTIGGMLPHVQEFASALSSKGYITLAVNYFSGRGKLAYAKLGYDQHIVDAYDHLITLPMVDPERIGMVGFSLGPRKALEFSYSYPKKQIRGIVSYYVGRLYLEPAGLPGYPPILFLHGEKDQESDPEEIRLFCVAQKKMQQVCEFHIYQGVRHAFDHQSKYDGYDHSATADAFKRSVVFLDKYVKDRSN